MDAALVRRLASPEGAALFDRIGRYAADAALALTTTLRAEGHDPELVTAALAQARLRAGAEAKLGPWAATALLTSDGAEQATRPELARRHAERFVAAGVEVVYDVGCGIGSDATAFAAAGLDVVAVEADPVTAEIARANLARWPSAEVRQARAEELVLPTHRRVGVWLDPARRVPGVRDRRGRARRIVSLDGMSPSWDQVQELAAGAAAAGAKLAPAFPHSRLPMGAEAQWTSWRGDVLECVVWWGSAVHAPGRSAAVCRPAAHDDPTVTVSVVGEADAEVPVGPAPAVTSLAEVGDWVYEADPAVVRAGLSGALPGRPLAPGSGWSTGPEPVLLPWLRCHRVQAVLPLRVKQLRAWLRERDIGTVTVKKRAASVDPEALRAALRGPGRGSVTLLVTTIADRQSVVVLGV
ncbi:MAG TPA: class I SAM-dependent methyltransferase [Dermatophilaceae bacterium]|nr:class I SAM-dependent methyltransferase [Dermatophilaceae bacterium]